MKSEIRQNKVTKQWVIYAPTRRKRPSDFRQSGTRTEELSEHDPACPFCPGNEGKLPSIIMELHGSRDQWQTRTVPNKFPALIPEGGTNRTEKGIYLTMPGYGRHEVIIESPKHNRDIAMMTIKEVEIIIDTYQRRYLKIMEEHRNLMVIIFRNHGQRAGTSLIHPHSQLIVTGIVPRHVREREQEAQRFHDEYGTCVYCDIMGFEEKQERRIIFQNDSFVGFIPFFAEVPFEVWIMPKKHQANFGDCGVKQRRDLARALKDILNRIYDLLNDPDYNYVIHTSARYSAGEPQLHWYLQIMPRLTTRAGFEIGSGIAINPSIPENDALFLNTGEA